MWDLGLFREQGRETLVTEMKGKLMDSETQVKDLTKQLAMEGDFEQVEKTLLSYGTFLENMERLKTS